MKSFTYSSLLAVALVLSSNQQCNAEKDDSPRSKRGLIHSGVQAKAFGGFSNNFGHGFKGSFGSKSALLALEASKAASQKKIEANQIAQAAQAAQADALNESALTGKTAAAVDAADKTSSLAISLSNTLRLALQQAASLSAYALKSLQAAKSVEAAQNAMVFQAQNAADALSQEKFRSLKELQAAQAAALKVQAATSKAHSLY